MRPVLWAALLWAGALVYSAPAPPPQSRQPFPGVLDEHPAIQYATREPQDRVARLSDDVARGSRTLVFRDGAGYLPSILEVLGISPESQLLVMSKTGVQRAATSPRNPRALYFDESVVVGYIPRARFIEIAAHDPEQGVIFYTVDQTIAASKATAPISPASPITRRTNCLTCHVSGSTLDVPGMITRSNFVDADGDVIPQLGFHLVDHRTPLAQRWGGWFVTGNYVAPTYGGFGHMGNVATTLHTERVDIASTSNEVHTQWMDSKLLERGYASHDSDIAALMVFDHQMRAINLLTRLNWETRVAAYDGAVDFGRGPLRELVHDAVDYFLFVDEAPPPARVTPRPGFAAAFAATGPRDRRGRSLRELDLERRLLRYPCSYMVQSAAFRRLPEVVRGAVYRRMGEILSGRDAQPKYSHLSAADRQAITEILRETVPDWPESM